MRRFHFIASAATSLGLILSSPGHAVGTLKQDISSTRIVSLPLADSGGQISVDQDATIAFQRPANWKTKDWSAVKLALSGPNGQVNFAQQNSSVSDSLLIKPEHPLLPGETYVLEAAWQGKSQKLHLLVNGRKGGSGPSGVLSADQGRWVPNLSQQRDDWYSNLPDHSLTQDQLLHGEAGTTALSGQVRMIRDIPLAQAKLTIGKVTVKTDSQGRFLLDKVPAGSQTLTLEAEGYGTYQAHVDLKAGKTNFLPYTMWVSRLATEYKVKIDSPTKTDVVLKNPEMPGFELRIAKGTVIKDRHGQTVNELTITPLPIDRSPFPLPKFNIPTYFTIQPGAARLYAADGKTPKGAQLVYPNFQNLKPGEGGQFWNYDPLDRGWYSYGKGRVSADGEQVVPDEGVLIYELTGAMFLNPTPPPPGPETEPEDPSKPKLEPEDPQDGNTTPDKKDECVVSDPIDCSSGTFVWNQTDLSVKDIIPVTLGRQYIQEDDTPRAFGRGWASNFDYYISSSTTRCCSGYQEADYILPSGQRTHFIRASQGTGYSDAVLVHVGSQSDYYGATMTEAGSSWTVSMRDGTKMTMPWGSAVTEIKDRNDNTLTITRSGQLPTKITGPTGRSITITLDSSNRIASAMDDQGRKVTYTYDAEGYLTTVTYPDNTTDQYSYVSFPGNRYRYLASHRDRRGVLRMTTEFSKYVAKFYTQFQYDGGTGPGSTGGGTLSRYATATAPSVTSASSASGTTTTANPNDALALSCVAYKPSRQIYPDGGFYTFEWTIDNYCRVMSVLITDPNGHKSKREFNIDGHLVKETVGIGTPLERVVSTVARTPENPRWSARGGMPPGCSAAQAGSASCVPQALPTDPTNDAGSNFVKSMTDSAGRTTAFTYDSKGNPIRVVGPRGTVTATYNSLSQPLTITNELGQTTNFTYDAMGNLLTVKDALGRTSSMTYTPKGQVATVKDPLNRVTTYQYDGANLMSVTDLVGRKMSFTYDSYGQVSTQTDPLGRTARYQYDVNGQLLRTITADGNITVMQYDNGGNLLQLTDPLNRAFKWAYDWNNRVISSADPLNQAETFAYDLNGNPTSFTDRKGQTSSSTYDALERLYSTTDPVGTTTYGYDNQDRLTSLTENGRNISYAYDNLDQLLSETTPEGKVSYTYDALGKRTSMSVNGGNTITYAYDNGNRLTSMTRGSQTVIFTYDDADRVTGISLPNGLAQLYTYDNADQLTEIKYMKGTTQLGNLTYTYDNAGQRTSMGGSFARTILPTAVPTATYDSNNRLTNWKGQNLTYDANGNLTSDDTYTYIWNARDQLTQVKQGTNVVGEYAYDTTGRRYSRTLNGNTTSYLYDGISAVQEKADATTDLFGIGVDNYFSKTTNGTTQIYLKDALGSTLGLSDSNGTLSNTYTYDPYGKTSQTGKADSSSNQYTGREKDIGNLYYYRARYYNTEFNRFISQDPIGLVGGMNWYGYVGGVPTSFTDSLGLAQSNKDWIFSGAGGGGRLPMNEGPYGGVSGSIGSLKGNIPRPSPSSSPPNSLPIRGEHAYCRLPAPPPTGGRPPGPPITPDDPRVTPDLRSVFDSISLDNLLGKVIQQNGVKPSGKAFRFGDLIYQGNGWQKMQYKFESGGNKYEMHYMFNAITGKIDQIKIVNYPGK